VNVAVLDTGVDALPDFAGRLLPGVDLSGDGDPTDDGYGHGTFVAGLIAGDGAASGGLYKGEAPGAGIVPVKAAGPSGDTDLATIIAGVAWVIAHHQSEHIGVLNMSLGYVPDESTLVDPLDQVVQQAWDAGVVVVVAAGNDGPFNGTILSPGDDPSVITVGSLDDHGAISHSGDTMSTFSSVGPTNPDGWFKPDLVASGQSVVSLRAPGSTVDVENPLARIGAGNFVGSGTSFSTAVVSGAAALVLADHPNDTPDEVKAALLGTASPGPVGNPFVDGHGALNVAAANAAPTSALLQAGGQVDLTQPAPGGNDAIEPGATVTAGYSLQMTGLHPAATGWLAGGETNMPVACTPNGATAGDVEIDLPSPSYSALPDVDLPLLAASQAQASATVPDLCGGEPMYPAQGAQVSLTGSLVSTDTVDPVLVSLDAGAGSQVGSLAGQQRVVPAALAEPGTAVHLSSSWELSSWNPANWAGPGAPASPSQATAALAGSAPNGSAWNGSAWNGSAWKDAAWAGSAWAGSAWKDSTWSGSSWNGSAWKGESWSGSSWSGSAWKGESWSGSSWGADSGSTSAGAAPPSATSGASPYPGYRLDSTNPDLWCPDGVVLGHPGQAGTPGSGGAAGTPGCGSNGANGGNGGNGDAQGAAGGPGGPGGSGGCPPSTDAEMAAGQYPCNGSGANGGSGGNGGSAQGLAAGGAGGAGGDGGDAQHAQGGAGGAGATALDGEAGGSGGAGGSGSGCVQYDASYWVSCPAGGGSGGNGGQAAPGADGGSGGDGGAAGTSKNANGGNGANGGNATPGIAGAAGAQGTEG
jgi:hypothetical protein